VEQFSEPGICGCFSIEYYLEQPKAVSWKLRELAACGYYSPTLTMSGLTAEITG